MIPGRHYSSDDSGESVDDLKPTRDVPIPARAWLVRRSEDDPEVLGEEPSEQVAWWRLFVELDEQALEVFGEFAELLEVARALGVEEYFVWSPARRTYVQLDATNVQPQE